MTGRPFSTFQSEGWARTGNAHKFHYYRPSPKSGWSLTTLCRKYASMDGLRPRLMVDAKPTQQCMRCAEKWLEGAMQEDTWFGEEYPS